MLEVVVAAGSDGNWGRSVPPGSFEVGVEEPHEVEEEVVLDVGQGYPVQPFPSIPSISLLHVH